MFLFNIIKWSPNTPLLEKTPLAWKSVEYYTCTNFSFYMRHTYVYKMHTIAGCCTGVMSKHSTVYRECKVDVNTNTSFVGYNFMHFLEIHRYEQIKEKKKKKSVLPVRYIMS